MTFVIPDKTRLDQAAASDPARSAWVDANAGSGKTHVLARRVVRLLLRGTPPDKVLCLTFTKAAAANMANRVLAELAKFATAKDDDLDRALVEIDGGTPGPQRRARARRLFAEALETPGGLKVQTIHAFCDRVLHQFPFEAGVPAGFSVLDERLGDELLSEARARVLVEAANDPASPLGRALETAIASASDDGLATALAEAVQDRHAITAWIKAAGGVEAASAAIAESLGLERGDTRAGVEALMLASPHLPRREWPAVAAVFTDGGVADQKLAGYFSAATSGDDATALDGYLKVFLTDKEEPRSDKTFPSRRIRDDHPALAEALRAERDRLVPLLDRRRAAAVAERSAALLLLAAAVIKRYEAMKARRALLDFDDLVANTRRLLEDVGAAWVLYKLDRGIDHVLVDEAQDTSEAQWAIVSALTAEFFAGKGAREVPRTVFAVGDAKQSIFGFQGAAPAMFGEMQAHFKDAAEAGEAAWTSVRLDVSFRTAQPVLDAVDRVFAQDAARAGLQVADDAALAHQSVRAGAPGVVELWPMIEPDVAAESREPWDLPVDAATAASPNVRLARRIAASVLAWTRGGRRTGEGTPITAGDVLILVRRRGPLFEAVLKALKDCGLPVAGADRLVLAEHIAVMDLLALGDAVLSPFDDLALACVLKSPLFGFTEDELMALAAGRPGTLASALDAGLDAKARAAAEQLAQWRVEGRALRPFDFYARVLGPRRRPQGHAGPAGSRGCRPARRIFGAGAGRRGLGAAGADRFPPPRARGQCRDQARHGGGRQCGAGDDGARRQGPGGAGGDPRRHRRPAGRLERPAAVAARPARRPPWRAAAAGVGAGQGRRARRRGGSARKGAARGRRRISPPALRGADPRRRRAGDRRRPRQERRARGLLVPAGRAARSAPTPMTSRPTAGTARSGAGADGRRCRRRQPSRAPPRPRPSARPGSTGRSSIRSPGRRVQALAHRPAGRPRARWMRGRLVHRLLEVLPDLAPAERPAVAAALAGRSGVKDSQRLIEDTMALIADPALARLFGPGSRAEVPIAGTIRGGEGPPLPVSGRIDRLWIGEDAVLIADFKTDTVRAGPGRTT